MDFKEIDRSSYRSVIRFFEKNRSSFEHLPADEYLELLSAYAQAIFDIGEYGKFIPIADAVIELSIELNIQYIENRDIYCYMLFKKSAAHFHIDEMDRCVHILLELIKIDPHNPYYLGFLRKCYYDAQEASLNISRNITIVLLLSSSLVIAFELFYIRPYRQQYVQIVEWLRNSLFILAWVVLFSGEFFLRLNANYKALSKIRANAPALKLSIKQKLSWLFNY